MPQARWCWKARRFPSRTPLWAGVPAKQIKELSAEQRARLAETWQHYVNNSLVYLARYGRAHIDALMRA